MLSELFYWVLNMSIIGSITGLVVLSLRKLKALPRFAIYVLWVLPLIRFWLPFGIANEFSLLSLISKFTTKTVVVWKELPQITTTNSIMGAKGYFPIEYKTDLLANVFKVASVVWVTVCCAAILTSVLLYFLTKSEFKTMKFIRANIYKSDRITAPAVYGIIRPKIIIPIGIADRDIDYIILHEQVHIERRDNLFRVIAVITACVHWFNPLSWVFLKYFFVDMELACDAKVLKGLNETQTKEYALTILTCASGKAFFVSAFGGAKTKVRIETILSYKRLTFLSSLCFALLVMAIAVTIITNATV
ncbi:M56 family metallopeptidase [Desulfosporosinus meridiei]|uniref:Antirepressor regulating drug resistance protein n=1 Tax=Desulfosporosinus meridiei (strain ATCC BAA-275 / DSM 13257 / KCTC 12902 / NCIMB 13706 / S10) TaxID=768704 RepID=J7J263_DESMD|nr:M56 family metallopeptidase [Desulfosporosinus meridiei]AFQ45378.1 antirepressor regulating drug resistance protein [Desulfosporosinus meridiei DSM 13257]